MHPRDAEDLEFDERNEAHLARHGITATEVTQVWLDEPQYVPKRQDWRLRGSCLATRQVAAHLLLPY